MSMVEKKIIDNFCVCSRRLLRSVTLSTVKPGVKPSVSSYPSWYRL